MFADAMNTVYDLIPDPLRSTLLLRLFGLAKIRFLFLSRPVVEEATRDRCVVRIPLNFWTKNHLGSMYMGVLAMGADVAGGLLAVLAAQEKKAKVIPIFKDFKADFLRRADGDVRFVCEDGAAIYDMIDRVLETGKRQNLKVDISGMVGDIEAAHFTLTLSVKPGR